MKFGVVSPPDDRDEYNESDNDNDEDYDDDEFDRGGERSSGSPKKKKRTKKNSCGIVLWTLDNRRKGLKYLVQASKNAQEEVPTSTPARPHPIINIPNPLTSTPTSPI